MTDRDVAASPAPSEAESESGWAETGIEVDRSESPRARFLRRFKRQRLARIALWYIGLLVLLALFSSLFAPHDPLRQDLAASLDGPGRDHWLGTDRLGRDTLSRLIFGARFSLLAAVQAVAVAVALGVPIGILSGLIRGWVDAVASTIADAILSIPAIVLALAIIGMLKPNLTNAMIAIGVVYAPRLFRVVRGAALAVREETFIEAARAGGVGTLTIARTHILPNVLSPLVVQISLALGFAVLAEAGVSFLGLGVQPPDASWGVMLGQSTSQFENHPELGLAPGIAIMLTVLAFNVLGDGLNDSIGREVRRE